MKRHSKTLFGLLALLAVVFVLFLATRLLGERDAADDAVSPVLASPTGSTTPAPSRTPTYPASPLPTGTPAYAVSPLPTSAPTLPARKEIPVYTYRVVQVYPHDRGAFTQGLVYHQGTLYEGTGLRGRSSLRQVDLETGEVTQLYALPPQFFGEGIAVYGAKIVQLTWQSRVGFVYDRETLELLHEFHYPTEGWGITHDGQRLIVSDGTSTLRFWDPETLEEIGQVQVSDNSGPVVRLNELEYVRGEVFANVWQTDRIARIDPETGQVTGWVELAGLLSAEDYDQPVDVLNGIAYDAEHDRLFVTGKLWPKLFEIELVPLE